MHHTEMCVYMNIYRYIPCAFALRERIHERIKCALPLHTCTSAQAQIDDEATQSKNKSIAIFNDVNRVYVHAIDDVGYLCIEISSSLIFARAQKGKNAA